MKEIKRKLMVCIVICITLILLSIEFQQIPTVFATTSSNSFVAYGVEAQNFVSMLSTKWSDLDLGLDNQPPVIAVSDINSVNLQNILDSMKNGAILVAINLPVDNSLVDAPRHSFGSTQRIGLWTVTTETWQDVVPPYWIIVTKQTTPSFTGQYIGGTAEDEQSHEYLMQQALDGVNLALFPDVDWHNMSDVDDDCDHGEIDNKRVVWPIYGLLFCSVSVAVLLVGALLLLRMDSKV